MKNSEHTQIHATCVAFECGAVLLRGPSGAGKSDLALRLIDRGARLVADDRVDLRREGERLVACAPSRLAGLIEVRGVGIVQMACLPDAPVNLVVDLVPRHQVERLPDDAPIELLGKRLRQIALDPFDGSSPLKVMLAVRRGTAQALIGPAV